MQKGGAVIFIPKLKDIIPEWSGYNGIRRQIETFREPFLTTVAEHKETYSDEYERDFIDAFLKKLNPLQTLAQHFMKISEVYSLIKYSVIYPSLL